MTLTRKRIYLMIFMLVSAVCISTCSSRGKATVIINLGFNAKNASAAHPVLDKIHGVFFRAAFAQTAPLNITSIALTVAGDGMDTIENSYTPDTTQITLEVTAGSARTFTLQTSTPSATLGGTVTRDIAGGETATVTITMVLVDTRIVIPDYINNRIVQIDDMSIAGWKTNDLGLGASFQPYDIDFDNRGRIYIANNAFGSGGARIYRIDDITDTAHETFIDGMDGIQALAIDRINNVIYYSNNMTIFKSDLEFKSPEALTFAGLDQPFNGFAFDHDSGLLYITHKNGSSDPCVSVCDPNTGTVISTVNDTTISGSYSWDVLIKSPYIYWTVYDTGGYKKVTQLQYNSSTTTLSAITSYTTNLNYPKRFVGRLKAGIYFTDENPGQTVDRIIKIDGISGSGRLDFGTTGSGPGNFQLFQ